MHASLHILFIFFWIRSNVCSAVNAEGPETNSLVTISQEYRPAGYWNISRPSPVATPLAFPSATARPLPSRYLQAQQLSRSHYVSSALQTSDQSNSMHPRPTAPASSLTQRNTTLFPLEKVHARNDTQFVADICSSFSSMLPTNMTTQRNNGKPDHVGVHERQVGAAFRLPVPRHDEHTTGMFTNLNTNSTSANTSAIRSDASNETQSYNEALRDLCFGGITGIETPNFVVNLEAIYLSSQAQLVGLTWSLDKSVSPTSMPSPDPPMGRASDSGEPAGATAISDILDDIKPLFRSAMRTARYGRLPGKIMYHIGEDNLVPTDTRSGGNSGQESGSVVTTMELVGQTADPAEAMLMSSASNDLKNNPGHNSQSESTIQPGDDFQPAPSPQTNPNLPPKPDSPSQPISQASSGSQTEVNTGFPPSFQSISDSQSSPDPPYWPSNQPQSSSQQVPGSQSGPDTQSSLGSQSVPGSQTDSGSRSGPDTQPSPGSESIPGSHPVPDSQPIPSSPSTNGLGDISLSPSKSASPGLGGPPDDAPGGHNGHTFASPFMLFQVSTTTAIAGITAQGNSAKSQSPTPSDNAAVLLGAVAGTPDHHVGKDFYDSTQDSGNPPSQVGGSIDESPDHSSDASVGHVTNDSPEIILETSILVPISAGATELEYVPTLVPIHVSEKLITSSFLATQTSGDFTWVTAIPTIVKVPDVSGLVTLPEVISTDGQLQRLLQATVVPEPMAIITASVTRYISLDGSLRAQVVPTVIAAPINGDKVALVNPPAVTIPLVNDLPHPENSPMAVSESDQQLIPELVTSFYTTIVSSDGALETRILPTVVTRNSDVVSQEVLTTDILTVISTGGYMITTDVPATITTSVDFARVEYLISSRTTAVSSDGTLRIKVIPETIATTIPLIISTFTTVVSKDGRLETEVLPTLVPLISHHPVLSTLQIVASFTTIVSMNGILTTEVLPTTLQSVISEGNEMVSSVSLSQASTNGLSATPSSYSPSSRANTATQAPSHSSAAVRQRLPEPFVSPTTTQVGLALSAFFIGLTLLI